MIRAREGPSNARRATARLPPEARPPENGGDGNVFMSTAASLGGSRPSPGNFEAGGIPGLPMCCPACHEHGLVTHVLVNSERFYLCCAVLAAVIRRCPDTLIAVDGQWAIQTHALRVPCLARMLLLSCARTELTSRVD
jgi:hypothetical protein